MWYGARCDRFHASVLRTRCAYFASVAPAGPASSAAPSNSSGGYNIGTSSSSSPAATTLCLLDDPLTSLDAETRRHVLQHCFHGLMRRNPRVALVVSCGEMEDDGGQGELALFSKATPPLCPCWSVLCPIRCPPLSLPKKRSTITSIQPHHHPLLFSQKRALRGLMREPRLLLKNATILFSCFLLSSDDERGGEGSSGVVIARPRRRRER